MDITPGRVAPEQAVFFNIFSLWRKAFFAISVIFFEDSFVLQCFGQLASSATQIIYILTYRPCARYSDNFSKIFNELSFSFMLVASALVKQAESSIEAALPADRTG